MYYVPESHLESTKQAIFDVGAGRFYQSNSQSGYQYCAWQVKGIGQFMPVGSASPFLGQINQLEIVEEWRVEVIVDEQIAKAVKLALLDSHPYEEVAFEFYQIVEVE